MSKVKLDTMLHTGNPRLLENSNILFFEHQYVSEAIKGDYIYKWTPATPVIISAQTGAGKNKFIEKIIDYLMQRDEFKKTYKFLILSNRIALARQEKSDFLKHMLSILRNIKKCYYENIENEVDIYNKDKKIKYMSYIEKLEQHEFRLKKRKWPIDYLDDIDVFGNVTIKSYQSIWDVVKDKEDLAVNNNSTNNLKQDEEYDFIIFDECHFFLADAKFNKFTHSILSNILKKYPFSIRVYMTSTPHESVFPILEAEENKKNENIIAKYSALDYQIKMYEPIIFRDVIPLNGRNWLDYYPNMTVNYELIDRQSYVGEDFIECIPLEISKKTDTLPPSLPPHLGGIHMVRVEKEPKDILVETYKTYSDYTAVIYEIERNYDYVDCKYLGIPEKDSTDEDEETNDFDGDIKQYHPLLKLINEQIASETEDTMQKWIIFVSNKNLGQLLLNAIGKDHAVYIDKDTKKKVDNAKTNDRKDDIKAYNDIEAYNDIITDGKFHKKVLIATAVLDNGININDLQVKHIAVLVFDKVAFLQMLGRKRTVKNEKTTLYLQEYSKKYVNPKFKYSKSVLDCIKKVPCDFWDIIKDKFEKDDIFYVSGLDDTSIHNFLSFNKFFEWKCKYDKRFFEKILQKTVYKKSPTLICGITYDGFIYDRNIFYDEYVRELRLEQLKKSLEESVKKGENTKVIHSLLEEKDLLVSKKNLIEREYENESSFEKMTIIEQLSWMDKESSFNKDNYLHENSETKKNILDDEKSRKIIEEFFKTGRDGKPYAVEIEEQISNEDLKEYGMSLGKEQDDFFKKLTNLCKELYGNFLKSNKYLESEDRKTIINNYLKELKLPYKLRNRGDSWLLEKLNKMEMISEESN